MKAYKGTTITILVLSLLLNFRLIKVIYTNISSQLNWRLLREDIGQVGFTARKINMLLSILMVPSDVALCFVAISAF